MEARAFDGEDLGSERIASALARSSHDPRSIVNGVLATAREHGVAFEDVVTVPAIRV